MQHVAGWDCVHGALGEIRACCADFEHFFNDVSGQLGAMATELAEHEQEWTTRQDQYDCQPEDNQNPRSQPEGDSQGSKLLEEQCRALERQHVELEQDRRLMESELESVRNRAAELTEALSEQKRTAQQQQSQWTGELKRMRRLLEGMSQVLVRRESLAGNGNSAPGNQPTTHQDTNAANVDPVLDSVMAQFEMLQKDLAERRANSC